MSANKRIVRFVICHSAALVLLFFVIFVYRCPFHLIFHFPCPGCGISRAWLAALRLDFKSAFAYHPLFFTAPPVILYVAHRNRFKKRLGNRTEIILLIVLSAAFLALYVYRITTDRLTFL